MRSARSVLLAALVAASFWAGCMDDGSTGLMTASEALPKAEARAHEIRDDAVLVSALATELGPESRRELASDIAEERAEIEAEYRECIDEAEDAPADCRAERQEDLDELRYYNAMAGPTGAVGDGRARAWSFTFLSPQDDSAFEVVVDARGVIHAEDTDLDDVLAMGEVKAWEIDSDEATQVARRESEAYAQIVTEPSAQSFLGLFQAREGPYWIVGAGMDGGDEEVILAIDAINGTVGDLQAVFGSLLPAIQEFGYESGTYGANVAASIRTGFTLEADHGAVALRLTLIPPPVLPVEAVLRAPDGTEWTFDVPARVGSSSEGSTVAIPAPAGDYEFEFSTPVVAYHQYEIGWCTDGFPMGAGNQGSFFDVPCELLPDEDGPSASETISRWAWLRGP